MEPQGPVALAASHVARKVMALALALPGVQLVPRFRLPAWRHPSGGLQEKLWPPWLNATFPTSTATTATARTMVIAVISAT